jgi:hypothetical protein
LKITRCDQASRSWFLDASLYDEIIKCVERAQESDNGHHADQQVDTAQPSRMPVMLASSLHLPQTINRNQSSFACFQEQADTWGRENLIDGGEPSVIANVGMSIGVLIIAAFFAANTVANIIEGFSQNVTANERGRKLSMALLCLIGSLTCILAFTGILKH